MRDSIQKGIRYPESEGDFNLLINEGAFVRYERCQQCGLPFPGRTHSEAGWRDTQIVGWCEDCYDALMGDEGEGEDGPR